MITHKMNKNNSIFLWRIVFTFGIVIFHYNQTYPWFCNEYGIGNGGRLIVEFFFIVSGFLMAYKCNTSDMNNVEYIKSRLVRLYPEYLCMLILVIPIWLWIHDYSLKDMIIFLVNTVDEVLLLQGTGVGYVTLNGSMWYVSCLVLCSFFLWFLYQNYRRVFLQFISPLVVIIIYSYLYYRWGLVTGFYQITNGIISEGLMRGFAGMILGIWSYHLYLYMSGIVLKKGVQFFLKIVEWTGFISVLYLTWKLGSSNIDFILIAVMFLCVTLSFSNKYSFGGGGSRIIHYLSDISYSIYIYHIMIIYIFMQIFNTKEWNNLWLLLYLSIVIGASALLHKLVRVIQRGVMRHKKRIRSLFLEE